MATATRSSKRGTVIFTKGQPEVTVYSLTEKLISLFLELDSNNDGSVSRNELISFYQRNGLDRTRVDDWMARFDTDADGRITMEEFSRGLGIGVDELKVTKQLIESQRATKLNEIKVDDIEVLNTTMPVERQEEVVRQFKDYVRAVGENENRMNEVNDRMKQFLNDKYGRIWQCITLTGSYWINFSHEPFMSIQFKYKDKYICLAWRTHRA